MIHYEWFQDPKNLHPRILLDLAPYFRDANLLRPGVTKPIFEFNIGEQGSWTLKIEIDGRDGLPGGPNAESWDHVFTEKSPGAKPFTVPLTPANSRWTLTAYTPHGNPIDSSEILLGLDPYRRSDGAEAAWTDRNIRIRDVPLKKVEQEIVNVRKSSASWRPRLE